MTWNQPDFVEIPLGMEVTAYANTDSSVVSGPLSVASKEEASASASASATDN